jgi:TolB-like protein
MQTLHEYAMKNLRISLLLMLTVLLGGCAVMDRVDTVRVPADARWAVLPFENGTTTPLAGTRAQAVAQALLATLGVRDIARAPAARDTLFDPAPAADLDTALAWARESGVRYLLTGTVSEWHYKVGVDGEPVVGLAVHIIDTDSGQTVWSGVGARAGWGRTPLAGEAQTLLKSLLEPVLR